MGFKEKMKDVGRMIIGKGPEVKFKNDVEKYAIDHGCSPDEAKKALFENAMSQVRLELFHNGVINSESEGYRRFEAGINEIFDQTEINKFRLDSNTALYAPMASPTSGEIKNSFNKSKSYYSNKYEDKTPNVVILDDAGKNNILVNKLIGRFSGDPRLLGPDDLNTILATYPEMGADLGMILRSRDQIKNHENKFFVDGKLKESAKSLGSDALKLLESGLGGTLVTFIKMASELIKNHNFGGFSRSMKMLTLHFGRVAGDTANFGVSAFKTAKYGYKKTKL